MNERYYILNLEDDPKSAIRFVREELIRLLESPGATNTAAGWKKIRFYNHCIWHEDGMKLFARYCEAKRAPGGSDEAGFIAAGWSDPEMEGV